MIRSMITAAIAFAATAGISVSEANDNKTDLQNADNAPIEETVTLEGYINIVSEGTQESSFNTNGNTPAGQIKNSFKQYVVASDTNGVVQKCFYSKSDEPLNINTIIDQRSKAVQAQKLTFDAKDCSPN